MRVLKVSKNRKMSWRMLKIITRTSVYWYFGQLTFFSILLGVFIIFYNELVSVLKFEHHTTAILVLKTKRWFFRVSFCRFPSSTPRFSHLLRGVPLRKEQSSLSPKPASPRDTGPWWSSPGSPWSHQAWGKLWPCYGCSHAVIKNIMPFQRPKMILRNRKMHR